VLDPSLLGVVPILGEATGLRAEVFFRLVKQPFPSTAIRMQGDVSGPTSCRATTLAATYQLRPTTASAISSVVLTEPAFWVPGLPMLYRLRAQIFEDEHVLGTLEQTFGLRPLGRQGCSFRLEGKRWVPRGVSVSAEEPQLDQFHASGLAAVIDTPTLSFCRAADRTGVGVIVRLDRESSVNAVDLSLTASRLAAHPAVMLLVLPADLELPDIARCRRFTGTTLLGLEASGERPPPAVPAGIDCLFVHLHPHQLPHPQWRTPPSVPLVACRSGGSGRIDRRAVDQLQAELAAWRGDSGAEPLPASWDWAGYLVL
jgi:hypothetical protein